MIFTYKFVLRRRKCVSTLHDRRQHSTFSPDEFEQEREEKINDHSSFFLSFTRMCDGQTTMKNDALNFNDHTVCAAHFQRLAATIAVLLLLFDISSAIILPNDVCNCAFITSLELNSFANWCCLWWWCATLVASSTGIDILNGNDHRQTRTSLAHTLPSHSLCDFCFHVLFFFFFCYLARCASAVNSNEAASV